MEKYEYLTGEDLRYKPDVVQKAKFKTSTLGQIFNKGLNRDEKQEGKYNIKGKNDQQLDLIRDQNEKH